MYRAHAQGKSKFMPSLVAQGAESNFTAWTHHERTTIDSSVQTEFSWRETMTSKMLSRELKVLKGKLLVSWPVSSI